MILEIIKIESENSNILKNKCVNINKNTPLDDLILDMFETCEHYGGVGLSANQIGYNINLFIINLDDFKEVFINPKIKLHGNFLKVEEGCLSCPDINVIKNRSEFVDVEYFNDKWEFKSYEFKGFMSIIIQHEYDHLNGKLIIDDNNI